MGCLDSRHPSRIVRRWEMLIFTSLSTSTLNPCSSALPTETCQGTGTYWVNLGVEHLFGDTKFIPEASWDIKYISDVQIEQIPREPFLAISGIRRLVFSNRQSSPAQP
ncbi:hypothetical protein BDN71DRAFT_760154 [Pleurotus eryngii]|uniref:Uncharacterized protein n=1 Tax=Pleurotus eryngii TaxID=5323 RepID=A0A9P6D8T5_PLEER|nr:hypothetical protein BDN71DRAFT_760154 [Pleurotus eryngii]